MAQAKTVEFSALTARQRDVFLSVARLSETCDGTPSGNQIAHDVDTVRGDRTPESTVYRALSSLEDDGLVEKENGNSRKKLYQPTDHGLDVIRKRARRFNDLL